MARFCTESSSNIVTNLRGNPCAVICFGSFLALLKVRVRVEGLKTFLESGVLSRDNLSESIKKRISSQNSWQPNRYPEPVRCIYSYLHGAGRILNNNATYYSALDYWTLFPGPTHMNMIKQLDMIFSINLDFSSRRLHSANNQNPSARFVRNLVQHGKTHTAINANIISSSIRGAISTETQFTLAMCRSTLQISCPAQSTL